MILFEMTLTLPSWIRDVINANDPPFLRTDDDKMGLVLQLLDRHIAEATGGPFAAAIFRRDTGRLVGVGVNRVVPLNSCIAHGEIMAIAMAQRAAGTYDLGAPGQPAHELFTSGEMCAMCFGAAPWSGIRRVVSAATSEDIREILGFDEGPRHPEWIAELQRRKVEVVTQFRREEACACLRKYRETGGTIYNGGGSFRETDRASR